LSLEKEDEAGRFPFLRSAGFFAKKLVARTEAAVRVLRARLIRLRAASKLAVDAAKAFALEPIAAAIA